MDNQWCYKKMPFFGKDLVEECNLNSIENVLKYVVSTHGLGIYDTPARLISYLSDYAPSLTNERRLIKICADSGVLSELRKAHESDLFKKEETINKSISKLENEFFVNRDWACRVVIWIASSLSWLVDLSQYDGDRNSEDSNVTSPPNPVDDVTDQTITIENGKGTYTGEVKKDFPHGLGKAIYNSGEYKDGIWENGIFVRGKIKKYLPKGRIYEGDFLNGDYNGKGKYTYENGYYYVGEFKDGSFYGKGNAFFDKGSCLMNFETINGLPCGQCTITWSDGRSYRGGTQNNKFNGNGRFTRADGSYLEGTFKDNNLYNGFERSANGMLLARYINGQRIK